VEPESSDRKPIDVDALPSSATAPDFKVKKSCSPSIISISSDSESGMSLAPSNVDEIESDFEPPLPSELLANSTINQSRLLIDLLDNLDDYFSGHNFAAFSETFDNLGVMRVHDLAEHNLTWLLELTDMKEPSAMILMGAALSEGLSGPFSQNFTGKGKSKM
jgi:hypothetical protein